MPNRIKVCTASTTTVTGVCSTETVSPGAKATLSCPCLAACRLTEIRTGSALPGGRRITSTSSATGLEHPPANARASRTRIS